MSFTERAVTFACARETLLGILAVPEQPATVGVVIVVGGPQYRVGSHRQFLLLSRALAAAGYPVLRFDYRGMGESTGELRDFETVNEDIAAAISAFQLNCPQVERIVLWGLCDAASANLLYWDAAQDGRVSGLVLLNPWVRSEATLARAHIKHYYGQRLLQADFWRKLLSGKLGLGRAIGGFLASLKSARRKGSGTVREDALPFQKKMERGLGSFPGRILLILSGNDYTAKEFIGALESNPVWAKAFTNSRISRLDVENADHTFSTAEWRQQVELATLTWLREGYGKECPASE